MALPNSQLTAGDKTSVSSALGGTSAFLDLIMGTQANVSNTKSAVSSGSVDTTETSGGTETKQTQLSDAAVSEMIRKMMEGTGGLADVATGAHNAGVYGDSTKSLLVQNLLTKIAGTVAEAGAATTVTKSPTTTTSTKAPTSTVVQDNTKSSTPPKLSADSLLQSLLLGGAGLLGSAALKKSKLLEALGLGGDAASISRGASALSGTELALNSRFGGSDFAKDMAVTGAADDAAQGAGFRTATTLENMGASPDITSSVVNGAEAGNVLSAGVTGLSEAGGGIASAAEFDATGAADDAAMGALASDPYGGGDFGTTSDAVNAADDADMGALINGASAASDAYGASDFANVMDITSAADDAAMVGNAAGAFGDTLFGPAFAAANIVSGGQLGEGTGELVGGAVDAAGGLISGDGSIADTVGSFASDVGDASSIVCYELVRTGGMKWEHADASSRFAKAYISPDVIRGYHYSCPFLLRTMRTHKWAYKFIQKCAIARSLELIEGNRFGKLVRQVFEPICWVIGKTIGRKAPLTFNISTALGGEFNG